MQTPLALSVGEPAGIGPDIAIKAWLQRSEFGLSPFYLIGDARHLAQRAAHLGLRISSCRRDAGRSLLRVCKRPCPSSIAGWR